MLLREIKFTSMVTGEEMSVPVTARKASEVRGPMTRYYMVIQDDDADEDARLAACLHLLADMTGKSPDFWDEHVAWHRIPHHCNDLINSTMPDKDRLGKSEGGRGSSIDPGTSATNAPTPPGSPDAAPSPSETKPSDG
jgi:hypothetical protein